MFNLKSNIWMAYKVFGYKISRLLNINPSLPFVITFSVTNQCQSRCKTCNLWKIYKEDPSLKNKELKLHEIEKIFKKIGKIYFFNVSGGEPYLRKDLPQIIELACKYLKPDVIHIPTNAIATNLIENQTIEILKLMKKNNWEIPLTVKPSFDGIEEQHDKLRGVKGNFKNLLRTIEELKKIKRDYPNLHVGVGTVISKFNFKDIDKISNYGLYLDVDTYISEIAEEREELLTINSGITPIFREYEQAINYFSKRTKELMKKKKGLNKITMAFRLVYYQLALKTIKKRKQVIPCYAGWTNAHITPYGDIWFCCILGNLVGNLRDSNYDLSEVWHSKKAGKVRRSIKNKVCYCPMANQFYSNILLDFKSLTKVIYCLFKSS